MLNNTLRSTIKKRVYRRYICVCAVCEVILMDALRVRVVCNTGVV